MYRIIGADGRQYGPAPAAQLREWIAENRANAQTLVQPEGSAEWRALGTLPEFAGMFVGGAAQAVPPPKVSAVDHIALANELIRRDFSIRAGDCISRAWTTLTGNFWPIVGVSALLGLMIGVCAATWVAGLILVGPLAGGLNWYMLKHIRGQRPRLEDAFAGFTLAFVQLMLASIVLSILTGLGLLCCILPGIYLSVAWMLTLPLVIDKRLGFWEAMELSRRVITHRWWSMLWLAILTFLINGLGVLCCLVGVFITAPWGMLAIMYAYEDIFGAPAPGAPSGLAPATPAPAMPAPSAVAPTPEPAAPTPAPARPAPTEPASGE
jgi:uncharacterized membrane protein